MNGRGNGERGVRRSFPARPSAVADVRRFVRQRAAEQSFYERVADELVLAVSEAASNSALHSRSEQIEVVWREVDGGAEVLVRDQGVFGLPRNATVETSHHGWGFTVMVGMVDHLTVERGTPASPGTEVRLVKYKR